MANKKMQSMLVTTSERKLIIKNRVLAQQKLDKSKAIHQDLTFKLSHEYYKLPKLNPELKLKSGTYKLIIDYPLEKKYTVHLPSNTTPEELLKSIQDHYWMIYENAKEYGVYGHGIEDLYLERISVDHKNKLITLAVSS